MAATAVRRNTLQFDANVPYTLALKYTGGRELNSGRILFTTMEDEVFFLDPDHAQAIHDLRLAQNEPFVLTKKVQGSGKGARTAYEARRAKQAQQPVSRPAAAATVRPDASAEPPQAQDISLSRMMASSYVAAIDALVIAKNYAGTKGIGFEVCEEDIRASANSIFIEYCKRVNVNGGASWQRQ